MSGAEFLRDLLDEDRYTGPLPKGTREAIAEVLEERGRLHETLAELLGHVEVQNCDLIGAVQDARGLLADWKPQQ